MPDEPVESLRTLSDGVDADSATETHQRVYPTMAQSFESFYAFHADFDANATDGTRKLICRQSVRSIERWCRQIHDIEPIDPQYITDRGRVRQHFHHWCLQVDLLHPATGDRRAKSASLLDPQPILMEQFCQYLLTMLRQHPKKFTVHRHWIAFYQYRCVNVGWKIWRKTPRKLQSFELFQEIVTFGHCQLPNFNNINEVNKFLKDFDPNKSQFVNGINHVTAYLDGQIKNSILPDLRKVLGDPYFGYTDLGVAARCTEPKIDRSLRNIGLADGDITEYKILWTCFRDYKQEVGRAVNLLTDSDFQEIERIYLIRSTRTIDILTGADVRTRLQQIGRIVRDFMLRRPVYLDANINEFQSFADIIPSNSSSTIEYQITKERWEITNIEVENICTEPPESLKIPSHKQLFWLYYGLGLSQTQIGLILQANFGLNPNPGSVSLRLSRSHQNLFDRIHSALHNPTPTISKQAIDTEIGGWLKRHFDAIVGYDVFTSASRLGIHDRVQQLSAADESQLIELLTNCFEQQIDLQIPSELFRSIVVKLLEQNFYQPAITKLKY
jgi:hypothetical protein